MKVLVVVGPSHPLFGFTLKYLDYNDHIGNARGLYRGETIELHDGGDGNLPQFYFFDTIEISKISVTRYVEHILEQKDRLLSLSRIFFSPLSSGDEKEMARQNFMDIYKKID